MASTASTRQQAIMEMMFKVLAETKEATSAMNAFQKQTLATFNKLNQNIESMSKKTQRNVKSTTKQAQNDMAKIMAAPFVGGGGSSGFNKATDDFMLRESKMRGVTTGLRHEVGKLRNTLLLFVFATASIVNAFRRWFEEIVRSEAALVGLKSVAINTGQSFETLKNISLEMEQKGFLSLGGGAAALKNLAASNLTMRESVAVLKALTDAAAFNRQGTLSMEEAVVGATQGIKNQNSIMIDNAGVTKNVSVMYREYAASVGKTSGSLTEMEKRQAIVAGVLKEASLFAGNAEKSLSSYQGRITQFQTSLISLRRDMGSIIVDPLINSFGRIVETFKSISKGGGLGREAIGGIVSSIYSAVNLVMTLTEQLIKNLEQINEALKTITFGILSIGKVLSSPYVKLVAFLVILGKINTYFTGLLTRMRVNTLEKSFNLNLTNNLKEAIILRNNYKKIWWDTDKAAMQEARIQAQINLEMKKGNAELFVKEAYEKRINYLLSLRIRTQAQELELQSRINTLQSLGFEGAQLKPITRDTKGRFIKPSSKQTVLWGPPGSMANDSKQTLLYNAELGDLTRSNLSMFGKVRVEWGNIRKELSNVSLLSSRFWERNSKGAANATRMTVTWATTMESAGSSIANIFAIVGNSFMKIFMWYTLITTAVEIISDLFSSQKQDLEKINREIKLELEGTRGILENYSQISAEIQARSKIFDVKGGKNYLDIITKTGVSVGVLSNKLSNLANKIEDYELKLRAFQFQTLEGKKVNETLLEKTKEQLEEIKTQYNSYYQLVVDAQDKMNQAFEDSISLLDKWGSKSKGAFAQMMKNISDLYEDLTKIDSNRQYLETSPLTSDQEKYYNSKNKYQVLVQLAYKNYYDELNKIVQDGEKKITETMKKTAELRMQGIRDSIGKQFLEIYKAYEQSMSEIDLRIKELNLELDLSQSDVKLQELLVQTKILSAEAENLKSSDLFNTQSIKAYVFSVGRIKELEKILENHKKQLTEFTEIDWFKIIANAEIFANPESVKPFEIFKNKLIDAFKLDNSQTREILDRFIFIRDEVSKMQGNLGKFKEEDGIIRIPSEKVVEFQEKINKLSGEFGNLSLSADKVDENVKAMLEDPDEKIQGFIQKLQALGKDPFKYLMPEGTSSIVSEMSKSFSDMAGPLISSLSELITSGGSLQKLEGILEQLDVIYKKVETSINGQKGALEDQGKAVEDLTKKKLSDLREELGDTSKEMFDLNSSFELLNITLSDTPAMTTDLSSSYIDASGKIRLFDKSAIDLEKRLNNLNRSLDWQKNLLTRYYPEALAKAKKEFKEGSKEIKDLEDAYNNLGKTFESKKLIMATKEIVDEVDKFIESIQIARNEILMIQDALNKGINTGNLDFNTGLQENLKTVDFLKRQIDKIPEDYGDVLLKIATHNYKIQLKVEVDKSTINYVEKELQKINIEAKKINETIENSMGLDNIFGSLINLDVSKLKEIDKQTQGFTDTLLNSFDAVPPHVQQIFALIIQSYEKTAEKLKEPIIKAAIEESISALANFSYNLGRVIQETQYKVEAAQKDQRNAILEQQALYSQGVITAAEKTRRIAEINAYYAEVINNIWGDIGRSVLDNVMSMGTQIITQLAQQIATAQALKALTEGAGSFGAMGAGLLSFLPFGAILLGLGAVSAAISNVPELEAPTFDETPQNQLTKFGGTIRAEEVTITITPTFIIEGQQIFIGSGSVVEYVEEATELMKAGVQQAIDNQEFSFDAIRAIN